MPEPATGSFPLHLLAPPNPAVLPLPPRTWLGDGVALLRGVVYDIPDGCRPLTLDLWLPENAGGLLPVLVYVHGGAWRTGRRDDLGPRFRDWRPSPFVRLVQAGFAVACLDYRLSGEAVHPAQRDDVAAALAWLRRRAPEIGLDMGRTVLWGESAGGHLAALTALTQPAGTVLGCVTWYAPSNLTVFAEDVPDSSYSAHDGGTFEALMLGGAPAETAGAARDASPVAHVTDQAPPFLLLHGTDDSLVPARQSVRLAEALTAAGCHPDLWLVEGGNHLWVGLSDAEVENCFTRTLQFATACVDAGGR
ncbi:alpha/beta hydrolase fold domain-containing protein [Streptomyces sp. NPDC127100]|uniref:alpha/beta hydrolase fold domain-containing protein n=1 Tax=Streptomyces sp. NPDC127100 TaxID=3347138 RepID=UPI00365B05EB